MSQPNLCDLANQRQVRSAFDFAQIEMLAVISCHQCFEPGPKFIICLLFFQAGEEIFTLGVEDVGIDYPFLGMSTRSGSRASVFGTVSAHRG